MLILTVSWGLSNLKHDFISCGSICPILFCLVSLESGLGGILWKSMSLTKMSTQFDVLKQL